MAIPLLAGGTLLVAVAAVGYIMFAGSPKTSKYSGLQKIAPSLIPKTESFVTVTPKPAASPTLAPVSQSDTTTTIETEFNQTQIDDFDKDFKEMDSLIGGL